MKTSSKEENSKNKIPLLDSTKNSYIIPIVVNSNYALINIISKCSGKVDFLNKEQLYKNFEEV